MAGRTPSWKERENNRRRERRRRAISANIFNGLRNYGNYSLPKHCDNNQVLIALCNEAGWTVELDGTTYRKGRKPPSSMQDILTGRPTSVPTSQCSSPYTSFHPTPGSSSLTSSPYTSFNPTPGSSSLTSPASTSYGPPLEGRSLIPWLKNLQSSSTSSSPSSSRIASYHYNHGGSISAPVSPPARQAVPDWWGGINSSTVGFVSSQMVTPLQSGTCSPAVGGGDVAMSDEFVFKSGSNGVVKAWEGERIHSDDLELTLGCSKTR